MWAVRGLLFRGPTIINQTLSNKSSILMLPVQVQLHRTVSCSWNEFAPIQAFLKLLPPTNLHSSYNPMALGPSLAAPYHLVAIPQGVYHHAQLWSAPQWGSKGETFAKSAATTKCLGSELLKGSAKCSLVNTTRWAGMFLEECNSLQGLNNQNWFGNDWFR